MMGISISTKCFHSDDDTSGTDEQELNGILVCDSLFDEFSCPTADQCSRERLIGLCE